MKKTILYLISLFITMSLYPQQHVYLSKEKRDRAIPMYINSGQERTITKQNVIPYKDANEMISVEEEEVGMTRFDLQSQGSISNRIVLFDDYTVGAVFAMGFNDSQFMDKGTGYNFYNGSQWGAFPYTPLETYRTGWPVYQPLGENGEIVVSHIAEYGQEGLSLYLRPQKFQGNWISSTFTGPAGFGSLWFPRMASGGTDHGVVHLLAQTGGFDNPYKGVLHAPLYSRSGNGLTTWEIQNQLLEPLSANHYTALDYDQFNLIADGDYVAILYGSFWNNLGLLKSEDGGDSWEQTIIWEHPYPFFDYSNPYPTDTFYCVDGSHHLAFDNEHQVHVVFAISRAYAVYGQTYWFPAVDGIGYWNEEHPVFSNNLNALSPYGEAGSELIEDYSLIGWSPDVNGNGQLDMLDDWGQYYLGFSSMPQIVSWGNEMFFIFSSVTEGYDNGNQNYRHLWARLSSNYVNSWSSFTDLTGNPSHIFDECVFPSATQKNTDFVYLIYQKDYEPGLSIRGDLDPYGDNYMTFMKIDISVGIDEKINHSSFEVSQNFPNPCSDKSYITVDVKRGGILSLEIRDLPGQVVYAIPAKKVQAGTTRLVMDTHGLNPGVYFYTVRLSEALVTKKMIVK